MCYEEPHNLYYSADIVRMRWAGTDEKYEQSFDLSWESQM